MLTQYHAMSNNVFCTRCLYYVISSKLIVDQNEEKDESKRIDHTSNSLYKMKFRDEGLIKTLG